MNLHDLVSQLIIDTKGSPDPSVLRITHDSSLAAFCPEIVICLTILVVLMFRLFSGGRRIDTAWLALAGALLALWVTAPWRLLVDPSSFARMEIFTGMLVYDGFTAFMRGMLLSFLVLFIVLTKLSGVPDREDRPDVYVLALGATLGFCLMVAANHLLMVFLAIEMASVPSYALAGMLRRDRLASEASLKYAVYGAGAAGIMLYGISLIAGLVNAVHLPTVALRLSAALPRMSPEELTVLGLACLMITVGLAFKLSAVPFHFWCPDVFEGATAEIGGFLSVASKAAALALLVRVVVGFGWLAPEGFSPGERTSGMAVTADGNPAEEGLFSIRNAVAAAVPRPLDVGAPVPGATNSGSNARLDQVRSTMARLVALLAIITCTFGNLAAYGQTNIKRLLAYSTIAHAGYMMMAIPPMLALLGTDVHGAQNAVGSLIIYIAVYLFMNLGAFAVVAFLRNAMHSEEIADYAGLLRRCPGVAICFSIILLSLIGLPPLSGFLGKFAVFAALTDAFRATGKAYLMVLLFVGGLNSAVSLFYYLRIVRLMTMMPEPESRRPFSFPLASFPGLYLLCVTLPTALLIFGWEGLNALALAAVRSLFV
ncbi:MAG: NADH-quinone oxidoreductase subunit N [Pirellulaceae bacterium]